MLGREPFRADAAAILQLVAARNVEGIVAATSATTIHYVLRRVVGAEASLERLADLSRIVHLATVDREVIELALQSRGADFEDDVIVEAARRAGAECVVTRDKAGFKASPIRPVTPAEFLAEHKNRR